MKIKIISYLASIILRLIRLTCRYELHFINNEDKHLLQGKSQYLLAFFHQDELSLVPYFTNQKMGVLISTSKDGEIMSQAATRLGYYPTRGSSTRNAISGLIAAIKLVKNKYNFAIAVDGPKGPIYKVKEGILAISSKTNIKILPIRAYPEKYFIFNKAWNKAKLPKFFTKIHLVFGEFDFYDQEKLEMKLKSLTH